MADIDLTFGTEENTEKKSDEVIETTATVEESEVALTTDASGLAESNALAKKVAVETLSNDKFSPEEQQQIKDFAEKIDLRDSNGVIGFGSAAQGKVSDFASGTLKNVRDKDLGEVGEDLSKLVVAIKHNGDEKKGFFAKLFDNGSRKIDEIKVQLKSTEGNINELVGLLQKHQAQLNSDIDLMDKMYERNKEYFKEVSMYIEAGKMKLQKARAEELPELQQKAAKSGSAEDTQDARDYADLIDRFEKRLYDLEISRTVCLQTAPEIRMIQNSDTILSEQIQSTIVNTIPMWKTQMVMVLSNYHTESAIKAQNAVTDATNEMMQRNAEMLHQNAVDAAKASERGIVDIETLQKTNNELMSALDEIQQIHEEGKIARANAEVELANIETTLKDKLAEITANAGKSAEELQAANNPSLGM